QIRRWQSYLSAWAVQAALAPRVMLLNAAAEMGLPSLLAWPGCCGVFYAHDSEAHVIRGIEQVLTGQLWLPRRVLDTLYQEAQQRRARGCRLPLSRREWDILNHVSAGHSNHTIAQLLFVSDNTIKSHIYRLFKKIDVHTRAQALQWLAKQVT
ncbi:MAG: LuxR C-terminal-related transcriptional regulator, partial [Shewanella sp.]